MRELMKLFSLINDIKAIFSGTYHKRYVRKQAYKATGKALRKMKL